MKLKNRSWANSPYVLALIFLSFLLVIIGVLYSVVTSYKDYEVNFDISPMSIDLAIPDVDPILEAISRREQEATKMYADPPMFFQTDGRWASYPYARKTIDYSGCGLCVFASVLSYVTDEEVLPNALVDRVGNSCLVPSESGALVNDMSLFIRYGRDYGVVGNPICWEPQRAWEDLHNNRLVIGSVSGVIRHNYYGGHIVLLYLSGNDVVLFDPKSEENSGLFSREEFEKTDWVYFYSIERSGV